MWMSIKPSQAASHATLRLEEGAPVSFRKAAGVVLECVSGRLWITITGQPGDHFLKAGERLRVESDGLGLVEGMPAGVMRVLPGGATNPRPQSAFRERTALRAIRTAWVV
jgi:hypothetical protein